MVFSRPLNYATEPLIAQTESKLVKKSGVPQDRPSTTLAFNRNNTDTELDIVLYTAINPANE
jgi:hypothetical protein